MPVDELIDGIDAGDPDPDIALQGLLRIARRDATAAADVLKHHDRRVLVWRVFGASAGLADFFLRHPEQLTIFSDTEPCLPAADDVSEQITQAIGAHGGYAAASDTATVIALRIAYRRVLTRIAIADLMAPDARAVLEDVCAALADAAAAAYEGALAIARTRLAQTASREVIDVVQLAVLGLGKTGARELNYLSDVDVIFVAGTSSAELVDEVRAVSLATRLAQATMQILADVETEPALWEVDAALRPEGKQGALVRTLSSHVAYYDRWAQSWEFQALVKARPIAGDINLGTQYVDAVSPKVWSSASRTDFVRHAQQMRERVTEHIPVQEMGRELKLGPGGLRDIEFTVQLLQLVHGVNDPNIRQRATLDALQALVDGGYIGRDEAASFGDAYRTLRLLEHRLQLRGLTRTHLLPDDPDELRVLARASGLADSGEALLALWEAVRRDVRDIHVRLFYRPLLSAVAALPEAERSLTTDEAHDRLAAIGFHDPAGALRHIAALTGGLSRRATIQRHLMPVMVRWFAEGSDPDYGLLAFRRISERLGNTHWYLRMLRDSSGAAKRLTRVLTASRYVGELMEWIPESVAWLDNPEQLRPRPWAALDEEARAIQSRHESTNDALRSVRALRRREMLRTAMGLVLGELTVDEVARALTETTEVTIQAALRAVRREVVTEDVDHLDFAIIGMGRFGGAEMSFGSDADVLFVYEPNGIDPQHAQRLSSRIVTQLRELLTDHLVPLDMDADLRPEGRNGPLVRSFDAYAQYYQRWSLSWEAQALLRARGVAGSHTLIGRFDELANSVRYPEHTADTDVREVKRIKARVEGERLPQGVEPRRHLKLGPGTLSDVEWLVQVLQLQHAHAIPELRTPSTLQALDVAVEHRLVPVTAATRLRESWILASRLRSANTLLTGQTSDVLPIDRAKLDAIARLLGYPPRSADTLEEKYLRTTRRARKAFEKLFYG